MYKHKQKSNLASASSSRTGSAGTGRSSQASNISSAVEADASKLEAKAESFEKPEAKKGITGDVGRRSKVGQRGSAKKSNPKVEVVNSNKNEQRPPSSDQSGMSSQTAQSQQQKQFASQKGQTTPSPSLNTAPQRNMSTSASGGETSAVNKAEESLLKVSSVIPKNETDAYNKDQAPSKTSQSSASPYLALPPMKAQPPPAAPPAPPPAPPPLNLGEGGLKLDQSETPARRLILDQADLLTQKRMLKKVDRKSDYNPVTLTRKELFEEVYEKISDTPPEHFPLHYARQNIISQNLSADLAMINFNGIDLVTDFTFILLHGGNASPVNQFPNMKKLFLNGCINVTDQGLLWASRLFPKLQMIECNACINITEKGLHYLFSSAPKLQNCQVMAANVGTIPGSVANTLLPNGSIQWAGNPLLSQGMEYHMLFQGEDPDNYVAKMKRKLVILRDSSVPEAVIPHLTTGAPLKEDSRNFIYYKGLKVPASEPDGGSYSLNIQETSASNPLADSFLSEGSIVMVAYAAPKDQSLQADTALRVLEIMSNALIKCPDIVFLLLELSSDGVQSPIMELMKARQQVVLEALDAATSQLYMRSWHLECLDFKGQMAVGWGFATAEALNQLHKEERVIPVCTTKANCQQSALSALTRCAEHIQKLVPWVHCRWDTNLDEIIDKLPQYGFITQKAMFDMTDVEARKKLHKRFSYPRVGKLVNLLQKWGEALYIKKPLSALCCTNMTTYEMACNRLMTDTPQDKVYLRFLDKDVSYWTEESVTQLIQKESWNFQAEDALNMLKQQGLLLPVRCGLAGVKLCKGRYIYVKMTDVPDKLDIIDSLWPEPRPRHKVMQNNRYYNFLPSMPVSYMPKLLRTLLKVYEPLYIWKEGFYLRQGPVDIRVKLARYREQIFDKSPVLILSARVIDLQMGKEFRYSKKDRNKSTQKVRKVMFSSLRQAMAVVEYALQKTKCYAVITLPCPECGEYSTDTMLDINKTWHMPYYLALASKHRACKQHKRINCAFLCDLTEEFGEGHIVPKHNYPYHLAAAEVVHERVLANRHRPMDPPEKCFYCGEKLDTPCLHCLMCHRCAAQFSKIAKTLQPGQLDASSFKLQLIRDGEMKDDEKIKRNTKGSVFYYKKGHCMMFLQAMTPFYWDEISMTILRGAMFNIVMTFGSGIQLKFNGMEGSFIDQNNRKHSNEMFKCRDTNRIVIKLESVLVGYRVRVVIFVRGYRVHAEEVDGWHMKLDIMSEKQGFYVINTPGIKKSWPLMECGFDVGSTLEMMDENKKIHQAKILERQTDGHLILQFNGIQQTIVLTSPSLMPSGTAEVMGIPLESTLTDEEIASSPAVPFWSFLKYQVPCGFKEFLLKKTMPVSTYNNRNLIKPCTDLSFSSVLHAYQAQLRDWVEHVLFMQGGYNFSTTSMIPLPGSLTKEDLIVCSQQAFSKNFKLHPICYYKGDISTVMMVPCTSSEQANIECFHCVHLVDNEGFNFTVEEEDQEDPGTGLLWAWTLMLLRLHHGKLNKYKALTSNVQGASSLSHAQLHNGLWQIIQMVSHALFLSLDDQVVEDVSTIVSDATVKKWRDVMNQNAQSQELVLTKTLFGNESVYMCESHNSAWQYEQELTTYHGLKGLYTRFVYSVSLECNKLKEIPSVLFTELPCLKDLTAACNEITTIPDEIGSCKQLKSLRLDKNHLTSLPESLAKCKEISRLSLSNNDFLEFPPVITKLKSLERLYMQYLHLPSLPEDIGNLENLIILSANGNCFTNLPSGLARLQKLKEIYLNGVAWAKVKTNGVMSKENFENDFLQTNNLHNWLERHNQDRASIFCLFDEDTNGTLDAKEVGKLNATLFHVFPRFGYKGLEQPDDDTPSGFPEVLLELSSLEYLSFQNQGIVSIPEDISKLTNLHTLNLSNNPNLLTVPAQTGALPLKRLHLEGCSLLKTPPREIRQKGFVTTMAYLKRLLSGSVTCQRTKLMMVGLGGAGKTSLVKALLSQDKRTDLTVGEEITDGIDICPWTVSTDEGDITYSVWDFAGQTVYYNTHQFFLTDRAVYLLMWNIRLGHEHAGLAFWLSSIAVHAPKAPIFVVGTHLDQVSKVELPLNEMQANYPQIAGFHFVSSHTGQGVKELQADVLNVTLKQEYMGEKIPGVWLNFEDSLKEIREKNVIEFRELEARANRSGIFEPTEVTQAVQFLHDLGSIQHFSNASLRSHVVVNPQWIVDVMACVVSVKDSHIKDGRLLHSDIGKVWKDYNSSLHNWMLKLTEEFDLTFPLKDEPVNLIPCLLPETQPEFDWPELDKNDYKKETKVVYKFDYLPAGLFNRGQVRLHEFSDSSLIWKRGSYLKKNGHICLIHQSRDSELVVKALGPRPENIAFLVHEVFETLILESFRGITYDFYLPCPDCMKLNVKDPHLFSASIIRRATEMKVPFLQCLKYFHTISITDLHAVMPPDSTQDFDLHLVQAVQGLRELQENLAAEIFVSVCAKDTVATSPETVLPSRIVADVEKLGYKCWLPPSCSMESIDEMAKALMDCKIFMVFMSNNYVEDKSCANLFKYARLTLRKPMILIAVGPDLEWKKSNMGILLADEVFINMMQASRYYHKFEEIETVLQEKQAVKEQKPKRKSFPPCFISYCWQNSAHAVAKGSKSVEGATGFGDPREIKDYLEEKGVRCWIDVERVGVHGLFEDIGEGLLNCKVVVVCMSDQYAVSSNCVIEFRYALKTLKLPMILAVVGSGNRWRASEVGIMSLDHPLVSFQENSNSALDKLLQLVKEKIPKENLKENEEEREKQEREETQKRSEEQQRLSFQELCELAQRKFLRQVSQYADHEDTLPYPNILLLDIYAEEKGQTDVSEKPADQKEEEDADPSSSGSAPTQEAKLSPREEKLLSPGRSEVSDFHDEQFCVHLLCEHDEGWHVSGDPIILDKSFGQGLSHYLPYIARITAIAKYSRHIALRASATETGRNYLRWLEADPSVTTAPDYQETYHDLRSLVIAKDSDGVKGKLERCLLPNGKFAWLCERHRQDKRLTILTRDSAVTVQTAIEAKGVDYMVQALREVDLSFLPEKLRIAQQEVKAETNKGKARVKSSSLSPTPQPPTATDSSIPSDSSKLDPRVEERASTLTPVSDVSTGQAINQRSDSQQRPKLTRQTTKSRACLLM